MSLTPGAAVQPDLEARVRAWRDSGDPADLWPNVAPTVRLEAHRRIALTASGVLNGKNDNRRLEAETENELRALSVAAYESGMGPLLGFWLRSQMFDADPGAAALLTEHLAQGRTRAARMDDVLERVLERCDRRGIQPVVLKGAHTRHVYFPDPGSRGGSDIDIALPPDALETAAVALREAGLVESRRTRRPFRSEWTPGGPKQAIRSLEIDHADNPWSVDLHIDLDRWYAPWIRASLGPADATATAEFQLPKRPARGLAQPALTAYLALNACTQIHEMQLIHLAELVLVIRRDSMRGTLEWDALGQLLDATRTSRFAYPALHLTERLAPGTVDPALLTRIRTAATSRMRRVVDALGSTGRYRFDRYSLDAKLMWTTGPLAHFGALVDAVWPLDDAFSMRDRLRFLRRRARMVLKGKAGVRAG